INKITEITSHVKSGSDEMLGGAKEVIDESVNLASVNQEITSSMKEMASGADQITSVIGHVKKMSDKNRENITSLGSEVSRFKVD
ncbi:MAG: methyl-accepting chemotaxis protein, partial [Treponema sp.]|nr:methyl-accepting chemotaxis protein [Treponema sp.]